MAKPSGTIYLCANAIVDSSYTNTVDFKNVSEQYAYWRSLTKYSISNVMYVRRTQQYIKVDKTLNELEDVNYLFFRAEENNKLYYCFVTSKEYVNDKLTHVYFETDVLQTYMFDYEVKQSYVVQEHVDRWTADHKPIYSRTDEGLDYGSEYTVESAYAVKPEDVILLKDIDWYLVVMAQGFNVNEGRSATSPSDIAGVPCPYIYLLVPSKAILNCRFMDNAGNYYSEIVEDINFFMNVMGASDIGSFVKQIVRLPYLPFEFKLIEDGFMRYVDVTGKGTGNNANFEMFQYVNIGSAEKRGGVIAIDNHKGRAVYNYHRKLSELGIFSGIESALPTEKQWAETKTNPYSIQRDKRFESKLLCYPYRYNYLSDWRHVPAVIKNEYVTGDKIKVNYTQSISFNAPARYWVEGYKKDPEGRNTSLLQTDQDDSPIINDQYYTYMLQNRNQLQADRTNALIKLGVSVVGGAVNGAISGGAVGGPVGAIGGALVGSVGSVVGGVTNYASLVRGQNAKQQDLKNLPDSILSVNDIAFNIQDGNLFLTLYRMKICCEFEELLADTFAMTGYTVKRVKVPNLKSRLRYNYVKTVGANIVGSFNQEDLAKIKAIFDNGITFWHYNTVNFKPFDYSYENIETSLI